MTGNSSKIADLHFLGLGFRAEISLLVNLCDEGSSSAKHKVAQRVKSSVVPGTMAASVDLALVLQQTLNPHTAKIGTASYCYAREKVNVRSRTTAQE